MITIALTGLAPSANHGIIGGFSLKRFKINTSSLNSIINVQNFFTIGTNIEEKVSEYLNLVRSVRNQIEVPEIDFSSRMGYRQSAGVAQYYYDSTSTNSAQRMLSDAITFSSGFSYLLEIDANGTIIKAGSDKIVVAVGSPMVVSHKEGSFASVDAEYTIYFDPETKLITSFGTGSVKDKKVKININFSWVGEDANVRKNRGLILFSTPDETDEFGGLAFNLSDTTMTQRKTWGSQENVGYFNYQIGCISNTANPQVVSDQIYYEQPYNAGKPHLDVNVVMDSTFYTTPEVYSRL